MMMIVIWLLHLTYICDDIWMLVWLMDDYVSAENYTYSEAHKGKQNYIRNSIKVAVDAYSGEVEFYNVQPDDPIAQTYESMFPGLFEEDIPEDIQDHFRYPTDL